MDMPTRRGYTDHEHLDEVEIIHMNGRVYDYNVGRFLSVDPVIVDPTNTQAINPYSYVMNNPLAYTDPSGYATNCDGRIHCEQLGDQYDAAKEAEALQNAQNNQPQSNGSSNDQSSSNNRNASANGDTTALNGQGDVAKTSAAGGDKAGRDSGDSSSRQGGALLDKIDSQEKLRKLESKTDTVEVAIGSGEVVLGGVGLIGSAAAGIACLVLEPCGAIAISTILVGGGLSAVSINDGQNRIKNARDGGARDKTIPFVGELVAGDQGKEVGKVIDKTISIFGGVKSLSKIAEGATKKSVEVVEALDVIKNVRDEEKENN
jgi:RHS repeat-associated protein